MLTARGPSYYQQQPKQARCTSRPSCLSRIWLIEAKFKSKRWLPHLYAAKPDAGDIQEAEGLLPEDDYEIPGTYMDAMNSNTKLGKAVRAAVQELEHLGDLETDVLQQCDVLLKQLGMKGSIFGSQPKNLHMQTQVDNSSSSSGNSNVDVEGS